MKKILFILLILILIIVFIYINKKQYIENLDFTKYTGMDNNRKVPFKCKTNEDCGGDDICCESGGYNYITGRYSNKNLFGADPLFGRPDNWKFCFRPCYNPIKSCPVDRPTGRIKKCDNEAILNDTSTYIGLINTAIKNIKNTFTNIRNKGYIL